MKLSGEFTIPADRDIVFERLNNAPFFASCIEGVSDLVETDPTHFTATLVTRIAYIKFKFAVSVELAEVVPPSRVVAKLEGKPLGVVGRLTSLATATLTEADGKTNVSYEMDVTLAGKLGSIGQPVLKSKAKEMESSFVKNVDAAFTAVTEAAQ